MQTIYLSKRLRLCLATVAVCASAVVAQEQAKPRSTPAPVVVEGKAFPLAEGFISGDQPGGYFHWTAEPWTGSDAPFSQMRRAIDAQIAKGTKRSVVLCNFKALALKNPRDARAQFAWAYAAFRNANKPEKGQDAASIIQGVRLALERVPSPKSYQYARMRWFFHFWDVNFSSEPSIKRCARRLLKRNPNDDDLKFNLAFQLAHTKPTNGEAMRWAKEYAVEHPERPSAKFLLGCVYESRFGLWLSQKDARVAQTYFMQCLKMSSSDKSMEKLCLYHINDLSKDIVTFRKVGWLKP